MQNVETVRPAKHKPTRDDHRLSIRRSRLVWHDANGQVLK